MPKKSRPSAWWPGTGRLRGNAESPPLLPRLPQHSESAVMERVEGKKRSQHLPSRTFVAFLMRWRYFVTACVMLTVTTLVIASGMIVFRDVFNDTERLPVQLAPSLEELNESIALGERYINSLYKPLSDGKAVQSEASGVPLRAHFLKENTWVLIGEDKTQCTNEDDCQPTTTITNSSEDATHTSYTTSFSTQKVRDALKVDVAINWVADNNGSSYEIKLTPTAVKQPVELWLDTTKLTSYEPAGFKPSTHTFQDSDQSSLRMLRFTIRHATQEAYLYWSTYGNDPAKAAALKKFLEGEGFTPGFDMRAPLYDAADALPDDLPVNEQAYPDCDVTARGGDLAYAYRSRVCLYEAAYINSGERDPFLQAWAALTILMKYNDPNHEQPEWGWWTQGDTPAEVSEHLRGQWNRSGWGIPKCTPFSCGELSGIRTSVFGALETQLGYNKNISPHGDKKSQSFADAAAKVIIMAQTDVDGRIASDDGTIYIRPGQAGSYLSAWVAPELQFTEPSTPKLPVALALWAKGATPTPIEYDGLIPSNSETTLDALGFLRLYRCLKYKVCA